MARLARLVAGLVVVWGLVLAPPAAAQPKTHEEQMAVLKALMERTQLIPKIDQLSFDSRYSEALPLAERLRALSTPVLEAMPADTAWSLERLARVHEGLGRWAEAEAATREALGIRESLGRASDAMAVENRNRLAVYYEAQGRVAEAERLYEMEGRGGPGAKPEAVAGRLNYLSVIRDAQGRYGDAETLAKRALVLRQQTLGPDHADVALTMNNLAMIYWGQGRRAEVEPLLSRAISILEKQRGSEHPEVGRLVGNLASVIDDPKRNTETEALLKRVIAIDEKANGPEHRSVLVGLNNLAAFYRDRNRLDEADAMQTRAVALIEASLARYKDNDLFRSFLELPTYHARMLTNHAGIRFAQGRHDDAFAMLERALALEEQNRGLEHPAVAHVVTRMAAIHAAKERWPAAHEAYARAAGIHIARLRAARTAERQGPQAARDGEGSREAFLGLALASVRLAEQDPQRRAALSDEAFRAAQWAERSSAGAALAHMSARFASGSDALAAIARERQDLTEESGLADRQLSAVLAEPPAAQTLARAKALRERMAAIEGRLAAIDQHLGREFPAYFALVNPEPAGISETQALLGASEVLIQYAIGPKESIAWLISRADTQAVRIPLGEAALGERVAALRCGLDSSNWTDASRWSDATEDAKRRRQAQIARRERCKTLTGADLTDEAAPPFDVVKAYVLYKALFGGIQDLIKNPDGTAKQLLVVPSGPLTQLPFQVLVTEKPDAAKAADFANAAWLARRHAITVLPSVTSLKALRQNVKTSKATRPFVGFGNPLLTGHEGTNKSAWAKQACPKEAPKPDPVVVAGWTLPETFASLFRGGVADVAALRRQAPLPETADELCDVARELGADEHDVNLGARATEARIKQLNAEGALAQARVVHFATHGLIASETESIAKSLAEPALLLTPPDEATATDDGLLTASEITELKLNADWVVLSACNTAAGGEKGDAEALSGLARAFFYAGAHALLVSYWYVDSQAAVTITTGAFAELKRDPAIGRAEALRRAMLAAMVDPERPTTWTPAAHPAVWAPFVVVGEGGAGR